MKFLKAICFSLCFMILCSFDFAKTNEFTAEELETGLLHELKPLASTFAEIEQEYKINSTLYASLVAVESGWGTSDISETNNNITSMRDYDSSNFYRFFESKEECLRETAKYLGEHYLSRSGDYFNGSTQLEDVVCYYYLGKPKEKMNYGELQSLDYYIRTIKQINEEILQRIERGA